MNKLIIKNLNIMKKQEELEIISRGNHEEIMLYVSRHRLSCYAERSLRLHGTSEELRAYINYLYSPAILDLKAAY